MSAVERGHFKYAVGEVWANKTLLYRGYLDDPRNTDNAWLESAMYHLHSGAVATRLLTKGRKHEDLQSNGQHWWYLDDVDGKGLQEGHKEALLRVQVKLREAGNGLLLGL